MHKYQGQVAPNVLLWTWKSVDNANACKFKAPEAGHFWRWFMQTIADVMTIEVVTVEMDDSVAKIREIFDESHFHHLVVVKNRKVVGVISDRDLLKNISPFIGSNLMEREQDINTLKKRAHQIMRRTPVVTSETTSLSEAAIKLIQEKVTCLPVVDEVGRLTGIVTWRDLMPHCFDFPQDQNQAA